MGLESYLFAGTVHTTCLSEDMRVVGSMHRDIEFKEVYLFSENDRKCGFRRARLLSKKDIGE